MGSSIKGKVWDLLAALPLVCWLLLVVFFSMREAMLAVNWASEPIQRIVTLLNAFFALTLLIVLIFRHTARARAPGWRAIAAGLIGGVIPMTIMLLPRSAPNPAIVLFSNIFIMVGTLVSIWAVIWLGRSFSVLPQARTLVTDGPYRYVRHPLYIAEFVAFFGLAWHFTLPWSLFLWFLAAAAQFPRIYFEERILTQTFPDYALYAARTARLIPGVY